MGRGHAHRRPQRDLDHRHAHRTRAGAGGRRDTHCCWEAPIELRGRAWRARPSVGRLPLRLCDRPVERTLDDRDPERAGEAVAARGRPAPRLRRHVNVRTLARVQEREDRLAAGRRHRNNQSGDAGSGAHVHRRTVDRRRPDRVGRVELEVEPDPRRAPSVELARPGVPCTRKPCVTTPQRNGTASGVRMQDSVVVSTTSDGVSRTRTGDLLGAITRQRHSLALVPLVQAFSGAVSSARFSQFGSTVGNTACLPRKRPQLSPSGPPGPFAARCTGKIATLNRRTYGLLRAGRTGDKIERIPSEGGTMQAIQSRARLAEPAAAAPMTRPALAISRAAAEEALRDGDGPVELTFDVVRVGGATEAMRMILERSDLERTLQSADGEELALVFDPDELERATEGSEVEAQGLRETAAVLTVAVAAMAGSAGVAST